MRRNDLRLATKEGLRAPAFDRLVGPMVADGLVETEKRFASYRIYGDLTGERRVTYYTLTRKGRIHLRGLK